MIIYCVSNTYATRIFQEFDDMVTAYFCDFGDDQTQPTTYSFILISVGVTIIAAAVAEKARQGGT
jgi:hypothetical protein